MDNGLTSAVTAAPFAVSFARHAPSPGATRPYFYPLVAVARYGTRMDRALTELPLPRAIARLAWPAMASMMLVNVFNLIDAFWVGRLGTAALGGMTAAAFLVWSLHSIGLLVGTGINAVVARRIGARQPEQARIVGGHGLLLALALALLVAAGSLLLVEQLIAALGLTTPVAQAASDYIRPVLFGYPLITSWFALEAVFRGSGDTRTPMWIIGGALLFNALIDPVLIFGAGPLPAMGIAGAAWATVVAHGLGVSVAYGVLRGRAERPRLPRTRAQVEPQLLWTLVRIGAPIALNNLLFSLVYVALTRIIATCGSAAVAAVGVGHRIEGLAFFTCVGFSAAAGTLVGQHLGAGKPERAARAAWLATGFCAGLLLAVSVLFFALAPSLVGIFSDDPAVVAEGGRYLRIMALFEAAMAFEVVLEGAFGGAGDTLPPMIVSVPLSLARVPLAYWWAITLGWGSDGIWWAISLTTLARGTLMALWFRTGRWKKAHV